jgi:CRISPR-associated RAMP protein (TIGR02581 family)
MHKRWLCQIDVGLCLEATGPLLVKSGAASIVGTDMSPVLTFRNGKPEPYLPGSSLKGVFRSHIERIARSLKAGSVCIPYLDSGDKVRDVPAGGRPHAFIGCGHQLHERTQSTADWYRYACAACRLFGSTKVAGRLSVEDAYAIRDEQGKPRFLFETRDGVAIDRFTGGAARGLKFDLEVVAAGSAFETAIRLESFELWQVAALHLLLDDLADEVLRVGSGRSRGFGAIKGTVTSFRVAYGSPRERLDGAAKILAATPGAEKEVASYGLFVPENLPNRPDLPQPSRRGIRYVYDLGPKDWRTHTEPLAPLFAAFIDARSWATEMDRFVRANSARSHAS